jgi:16S rRNA (cytosine967-C5)-methyltransferase
MKATMPDQLFTLPKPELPVPRVFPQQIQRAAAVLDVILSDGVPSDRALQHCFRAERQMGKRDRAQLQTLVFFVLRHWRLLDELLGVPPGAVASALPRVGMAVHLAGLLDATLADLTGVVARPQGEVVAQIARSSPAKRFGLRNEDMARLEAAFGSDAVAVAKALLARAPVDIRVNSAKAEPGALAETLLASGLESMPILGLPNGLRLNDNKPLTSLDAYHAGAFEIQDAGSQWIVEACQAQPGQHLLDLCAGAGGKSLGLAETVGEQGSVLACDTEAERLARLPERSARAGWRNIECQPIADSADPELHRRGPFDRVLIDAPCSGSGTWRRHPELRQIPPDLEALCATQAQLLDDGVRLTKTDGLLIYATCSLWREENEMQIASFLARHPDWRVAELPAGMTHALTVVAGMARIRPDIQGSDGFFFCVLQRKND